MSKKFSIPNLMNEFGAKKFFSFWYYNSKTRFRFERKLIWAPSIAGIWYFVPLFMNNLEFFFCLHVVTSGTFYFAFVFIFFGSNLFLYNRNNK